MESNIKSIYRKNESNRILQGDILNNVKIPIYDGQLKIIESGHLVILTQDCDLNQDYNSHEDILEIDANKDISSFYNKMLPSILLCPAYPADQLREGIHLQFLDMPMSKISKPSRTPWKNILKNETPRYHFLEQCDAFGISDMVLDFKRHYSLSRDYLYSIYNQCYCISLNELYREDLSNRFYNYHSRIGLP